MVRLADRILVFRANRIVGDLPNDKDYDSMSRKIMERIVGPSASKVASETSERPEAP